MQQVLPIIREVITPVVNNFLFPPTCVICPDHVDAPHSLCNSCFDGLHFITDPQCDKCGYPFAYDMGATKDAMEIGNTALCADCLTRNPPFHRQRSALLYDNASRSLITRIKYGDKTHLIPLAAKLMVSAGVELLSEAEVIIPVPMHWRRMVARKFNQSHLLASELHKMMGGSAELLADGLKRVRHTPPQASLDWKARQTNIKGAFILNEKRISQIAGKRIVLIDDVATTGATIKTCVRALKKAKPSHVYVLTLARRMPID